LLAGTLSLAMLATAAGLAPAQGPARRVQAVGFDDANGNGVRDAGEKGVPGVRISDQYALCVTGEDGACALDAAPGAAVTFLVSTDAWAPRGLFWRPLTADAHQRLEFPLIRRSTPAEFTFLHASDTHLSQASLPRMRKLRELAEKTRAAFVLITGDLIRDALRVSEAEARGYYDLLLAELKQFPVPVFTVPGNHEIFGIERHHSLVSPAHPLYGKNMYRHYLGPNYYSFAWGGVHFVGLDTADISDLWYHGHVDAAQLAWLEADLAALPRGMPVVTFNHIPFASAVEGLNGYTDDGPAPTAIRINGRMHFRHVVSNVSEVLGVIHRQHRLEIALGGHFHARETLTYETQGRRLRFYQTAAVVAPNLVRGLPMLSGITLYRVRSGQVDDGTFLPLD
jgi:predicted phosphodiesterase